MALKVLMPPPNEETEILLARFEEETQTTARLQHPNIVPVLATGQVDSCAYMAPEQALYGQQVEGRSDLYSLGVVLFRMITGQLPFRGSTPQLLHAHVYEQPPNPSSLAKISPEMEEIILQALRKNVAERFPDGQMMARALLELNNQLCSQNGPSPAWRIALRRWFIRLKRRGVFGFSQLF